MLSKKHIYLSIFLGISFTLFLSKLSFSLTVFIDFIFSSFDIMRNSNFIVFIATLGVYVAGILFFFLSIPKNYMKFNWLKTTTLILNILFLSFNLIELIAGLTRPWAFQHGPFYALINALKYFGPTTFLAIFILIMTFIVSSFKDENV